MGDTYFKKTRRRVLKRLKMAQEEMQEKLRLFGSDPKTEEAIRQFLAAKYKFDDWEI